MAVGEYSAAEANLNESYTILNNAPGAPEKDHTSVLNGLVELYDD